MIYKLCSTNASGTLIAMVGCLDLACSTLKVLKSMYV